MSAAGLGDVPALGWEDGVGVAARRTAGAVVFVHVVGVVGVVARETSRDVTERDAVLAAYRLLVSLVVAAVDCRPRLAYVLARTSTTARPFGRLVSTTV